MMSQEISTFASDFETRRASSTAGASSERQVRFIDGSASHFGLDLLVQRACDSMQGKSESESKCGLKLLDRSHMQQRLAVSQRRQPWLAC